MPTVSHGGGPDPPTTVPGPRSGQGLSTFPRVLPLAPSRGGAGSSNTGASKVSGQDTLVSGYAQQERRWRELVARLGCQVQEVRHLLGWSQDELARRAHTSQGTISRIESGRHPDFPLLSAFKVLTALAHESPAVEQALTGPALHILQVMRELEEPRLVERSAGFAMLLLTYHGLAPDQQETFLDLVVPIAEALR